MENNKDIITLDQSKFVNLLNKFGLAGSINTSISEAEKDEKYSFKNKEGKKVSFVLPKSKISEFAKEITDYTKSLGEEIHEIKNWYINAHNFIVKELGNDAPFFLMLLGITSKSRSVSMNLTIAKALYYKIKQDLANNKERVEQFVNDDTLKFGTTTRAEDTGYDDLSFIKMTREASGLLTDMKNFRKALKLYLSKNQNLTFNDAIAWMKQYFNVQNVLKGKGKILGDEAIQSHKLYNYTMNLLDPMNEQTPDYHHVVVDRHMVKYFVPDAADTSKSDVILGKVFSNTQGLYYALVKMIHDITKEVKKEFPELNANQVQSLSWFLARQKYSEKYADNATGGTYEREFKKLEQMLNTEKNIVNQLNKNLSFGEMISKVGKDFNKQMLQKQAMQQVATDTEEDMPF